MKDWFVHGGLKGRQPGVPMPRTAAGAEDISRENGIACGKIAGGWMSYCVRGQINDVQQRRYGLRMRDN